MKKRKIIIVLCTVIPVLCGVLLSETESRTSSRENMTLIAKETASPNKDYVSSEEDIVYYTVTVYQDKSNNIYVFADSSSPHYGNISYKADYNHSINKDDVQVTWATLMGSTEPNKNDEIACAEVIITDNGHSISEERINFLSKVIKTITDTLQ